MQQLLAVDVGGTKVAVAWADPEDLSLQAVESYPTAQQPSLEACLRGYLEAHPGRPLATGIGIAGPVFGRTCEGTNLPWRVDAAALEASGGLGAVAMVNDFHAATLGVLNLPEGAWVELNPHAEPPRAEAPLAVLGAGTGLGTALAIPGPQGHLIVPTEAGHADFAPRNAEDLALWRFLQAKHGRVSVERVLSGAGLHEAYLCLVASSGQPAHPRVQEAGASGGDPAAEVAALATGGEDARAKAALAQFMACYGAEAGNLALRSLARGGVYLTGGIAPKNQATLCAGGFLAAYLDKAPLGELVGAIPCRLVTHPHPGLLGAAAAARLAVGGS